MSKQRRFIIQTAGRAAEQTIQIVSKRQGYQAFANAILTG